MFGFATNETEHLMPAAITYAHELVKKQATLRRNGSISWLRPDAKSQVTVAYNDDGSVDHIDTIVLSTLLILTVVPLVTVVVLSLVRILQR